MKRSTSPTLLSSNAKMFWALALLTNTLLIPLVVTRVPAQDSSRVLSHPQVKVLPSKEKRWALIIGVNDYEKDISPLRGSVNDARALKDVLVKHAGFPASQIILMTTDAGDADLRPTRGNILDALERLSRQIPEGGLLLFSFSGHGISIDNDAFLIPADGKIYRNAELMRDRSIDVSRVKYAIQLTKAKQVLMFLDACRNNPLQGKGDAANPLTEAYTRSFSFETRNQEIKAFATIFATSLGDRAYEFFDRQNQQYRGFFSYAIEEGLGGQAARENGEITLGSLINYLERTVRQRVYVEKNQRQVPYPMTEGYRNSELVLAVVHNSEAPQNAQRNSSPKVVIFDDSKLDNPGLSKEFTNRFSAMLRDYDLKVLDSPDLDAKDRARINDYFESSLEDTTLHGLPYALVLMIKVRFSDRRENGRYVAEAMVSISPYNTVNSELDSYIAGPEGVEGFGSTREQARQNAVRSLAASIPETLIKSIADKASASLPKNFKTSQGIEMVYIPPGRFMMGSPTEIPVHEVTISQAFYLGKYEVTQGQWRALMGSNPSFFKNCGSNCPVETVSWNEIQDFIKKLNAANDGYQYRLPSEAEWEYACRAGSTGDFYAADVDDIGWYWHNAGKKTHPVGEKQPNAFGLYDMSGNVSEWCLDLAHPSYYGAPSDGSAWLSGSDTITFRSFRGGSWSTICRPPTFQILLEFRRLTTCVHHGAILTPRTSVATISAFVL